LVNGGAGDDTVPRATGEEMGAPGTRLLPIGAEGPEEDRPPHDVALASALGIANVEDHPLGVDVPEFEAGDLADAKARAVGQHLDRAGLGGRPAHVLEKPPHAPQVRIDRGGATPSQLEVLAHLVSQFGHGLLRRGGARPSGASRSRVAEEAEEEPPGAGTMT